MSSPSSEQHDSLEVDVNVDINHIHDEEVLRKLWQVTEDFAEKRRIRARMYKLREKRLKEFYMSEDVVGDARCDSPMMMMMESCEMSMSSSFQTQSTSSETRETSSNADGAQESVDDVDRKSSAEQKRKHDVHDDVVSEKIRKKTSERTERYQKILHEIEHATEFGGDVGEEATSAEDSRFVPVQVMERTQTSASSDSCVISSNIDKAINEAVNASLVASVAEVAGEVAGEVNVDECTSFIEELQKRVSHREKFDGDYKIIIETTETLRRIRTSEQENPVTQKVTVTRTVKQHVNGSILEDDQDEIIEDIDDKEVDEKFHAKKAFECSDKSIIENIDTGDRSNKSITNDIDSNVEIMELDIESQVLSDKDKTIDYSVTTPESMNSPRIDLQRNHSVDIEDVTENDDDVEKPGEKKLPGKTSAVSRTSKTTKSTTLTTSKTSRTVEVSARDDKKSQIPKFSTPKTTPTTKRIEKSSSGTSKASPAKSKNDTLDTSEVADESVDEFLKLERELEASTSVEEQHPVSKPTPSTPTTPSNRTASLKSSSRLVTKSTTSPLPVRQASTASTASKKTLDKTPVKKTEVSRTETPKSGIPRAAGTSSSTPKEKVTRSLSSGKSRGEANNNDDKPWRANSKLKQPETKTKGDVPKTPTKEPVRKISPSISRKKSAESPRFEEAREPHKPLEQEPEEENVPDVEVNGNANLEQDEVENVPEPKEEEREDDNREEEEEEDMIEVSINDNNRFQSIDETISNLSGPEQSEPNTPSGPERTKLNLALRETSKSPVKDVDNTRAKLTASPALDSPSVVMKARSLFDTSESRPKSPETHPKSPETRPKSPETRQKQQTSTSKIRSVFEVSSKMSEPVKTKESPSPVAKLSDQAKNRFSPKTGEKAVGKLRNPFEKKDPDSSPPVALCPANEMPRTVSSQETGTLFTADNTGNNGDDNEELVMLENMLNAATSYDERSRIRAQIRVVKKKLGLLTGTGSATSSPMLSRRSVASSEPPANAENLSESSRKVPETLPAKEQPIERQERVVAPSPAKEEPIERQEPVVAPPPAKEEPIEKQERKVSFSETTVTMKTETFVEQTESSSVPWRRSTSRETSPEKQVPWRRSAERETVPAEPSDTPDAPGTPGTPGTDQNQTPWRNSKPKPLTTQVSQSKLNFPRLPEYDSSQPDMADTLDITSSYGTGPMDENGRPLFGLGALRRKPKTSSPREPNPESPFTTTETRAFPEAEKEHAPIIESRSQPLNELQKLHEQQIQPKESPVLQVEKPRAKLRDSFTNSKMDAPEDEDASPGEREPIIMERSQALRDIIRRHEKVTTEPAVPNDPLPSPKPKAKLKDTFFSADSSTTEESREERKIIERSENFQNIVKRHQDLSSEPESIGPQHSPVPASPIKRPGILKKPKDWSSPSPQEIPSPIKESPRKTSIEVKLEPVTPFQKEASPVPEPPKSVEIPFKLTGESIGHTVRSTSTFQLQLSASTTERTVADEPVSSSRPWNRKPSVPEETQNVPGSSSRPWMRKTSKPEENQDVPEQSNRKTSNPLPFHNVPEQSNRKISNSEPLQNVLEQSNRKASNLEPFQNVPEQSNRMISNPEPFQTVPAEPKATRPWERKPADVSEQRSRRSEDVLRSTVQVQLSSSSVTPQTVPVTAQPNPAEPEDPTPWRRRSIPREPSLPKETIPATQTFVQSEEINVSTTRGRERSPLLATPQQGIRVTSTFATYSTQTTPRTEASPERTRTTPSFLNRDRDAASPDQGTRVSSTSSTYRTQTTPRTEISPERTRTTPSFLNRDRDTATPDQGIRVTSTSSTYRTQTTARTEVSPERTPRSTVFPTRDTRELSPATATPDQGIRVTSTSSTYRTQTTARTEVSPERTVRSTAFPNRDTREPSPATATPDQGLRVSSTPRSYGNTPRTEPSPDRVVRPSLAGSSVKALAQKFLSPDSGSATPKQNSQYPKAGLIFRSSSFRQNETSGGSSKGSFVQRSESLRSGGSLPRQRPSIEIRRSQDRESRESSPSYIQSVSMEVAVGTPVAPGTVNREPEGSPMTYAERKTSYQSSTTWTRDSRESSPSKVASVTLELTPRSEEKKIQDLGSPSKSFLEDRTPVRGMQDIIQRMRAGETNGHAPNNDDDHARSLLNKFLGAQILVQCTEPLVRSRTPDLVERVVTTTEHRNDDGHVIGRSITANQKGSRHEVSSTVDDQGRPWTTTTSTTAVAQKTVSTRIIQDDSTDAGGSTIVNGVDINICQDESKLRELLENCGDFETRRQIRARIKSLVEPKISSARTEESSSLSRSSFRSSSFRQSGPSSAFAKFQQLERNAKAAV